MKNEPAGLRESRPEVSSLEATPEARAQREAANGVRQADAVLDTVDRHLEARSTFKLRPSLLGEMNRLAIEGLTQFAGVPRPHGMTIHGSQHQPPPAEAVQGELEELCDYVNDNWQTKTPVHLAAYVMWRINWIHPYDDGNGRTARAIAYIILSLRMQMRLRGEETIVDQIINARGAYYRALETADAHWKQGVVDVSEMEELLSVLLARQFASLHARATGKS